MPLKLPQTRVFLYLYVIAMLVLHGWILAHACRGITQGLPDFTIFYTAGQIVRTGHAAELYDNNLQKAIQQAVTPTGLLKRGSILPYNHPPFEAVIFIPISRFSYVTAYLIWAGTNCALMLWLALWLRKHVSLLHSLPAHLWVVTLFTFNPVFIALIQGQDSILLLCCFALAYVSFIRNSEFTAGVWLGLGLFKFNLVLPFVLPLFLLKRKKCVAGLLATALALFVLSLSMVGWRALLGYPLYLWGTEQDRSYLWNTAHANQPNLRGLFTSLFPHDVFLRTGLLILTSGLVLVGMTLVWNRVFAQRSGAIRTGFGIGLLGCVLLSFHLYLHDLSVLLLAIVILMDSLSQRRSLNRWVKVSAYVLIGLLFFSPIYLVLTLRYKELELMAVVTLALFALLVREVIRKRADSEIGSTRTTGILAAG